MVKNEDALFTILWRQWPAGWHIRSLTLDGYYTAELLSEYPPFRGLVPGCLFPWDRVAVFELWQEILSLKKQEEPFVRPPEYTGYFGMKSPTPISYFYSAASDGRQAKCFLEIVALLDPYFVWLNQMIRSRRELFDKDGN